MPASFQIKLDTNNFYTFNLLDTSGDVLLLGASFENKADAEQAIKDVRVGTLMSNQIASGKTPGGDMFFVIKNPQGQVLVKSMLYSNQMLFDNALHQVKDNACVAPVNDLT